MANEKEKLPSHARVAKTVLCPDSRCSYSSSRHLSVELTQVELRRENAIAISYTWGEFDRKPRAIGHWANRPQSPISLELGSEWKLEDLIGRLSELSSTKALWIDQLCIPQKDETETREALASVPFIYRTFDVVVIIPGHPCKCIDDFLDKTNDMPIIDVSSSADIAAAIPTLAPTMVGAPKCLSNGYDATWFTRLWTRQELLYSRQIRIVWTGVRQSPCVFFDASRPSDTRNIDDLAPLAAGLLQSLRKQGYPTETALLEIFQRSNRLDQTGINDLQYYTQNQIRKVYRDDQLLARFMKGEQLSSGLSYSQHDKPVSNAAIDQEDHMKVFLGGLGRLSRSSPRMATKAHDYVVSIWIDCPEYATPIDYKDNGIPFLIEDALNQLGENHSKTLVTHAPRGLFDTGSGSGLWAVPGYLRQVNFNSATSIYRSIPMEDPVLVPVSRERAIPIHRTDAKYSSFAAMCIPYESDPSQRSFPSIFKTLSQAVLSWSVSTITKVAAAVVAESTKIKDSNVMVDWQQLRALVLASLWASLQPHKTFTEIEHVSERMRLAEQILMSQEIHGRWVNHHHELARFLITAALGLDEVVCTREGLHIIVGETVGLDPVVRIGLCRKDMTPEHINSIAKDGGLLTVEMTPGHADEGKTEWDRDGSTLYEAARIDQQVDGKPAYQVFAVWVPTMQTPSSHIGAVVATEFGGEGGSASVEAFIV